MGAALERSKGLGREGSSIWLAQWEPYLCNKWEPDHTNSGEKGCFICYKSSKSDSQPGSHFLLIGNPSQS
jgi:hypothetical protein